MHLRLVCFLCLWLLITSSAGAQPAFPEPAGNDAAGFEAIFNGKTLDGWDGDSTYWRVENGTMVGETTAEKPLKRNTFVIWRGGTPGDFELKLQFRITPQGNSGVNYRSTEVEDAKWALRGYQADFDGADRWTGQNYEERGRGFLALRGQMTRTSEGAKPRVVTSVGEEMQLAAAIKKQDWNELHIIARGSTLMHSLNGHLMSVVLDDDAKNRRADGLIGMQVHTGPPMKVEYRNIRLKKM